MASFFYSDNEPNTFTGSINKINATSCYLRHYDNYMFS